MSFNWSEYFQLARELADKSKKPRRIGVKTEVAKQNMGQHEQYQKREARRPVSP